MGTTYTQEDILNALKALEDMGYEINTDLLGDDINSIMSEITAFLSGDYVPQWLSGGNNLFIDNKGTESDPKVILGDDLAITKRGDSSTPDYGFVLDAETIAQIIPGTIDARTQLGEAIEMGLIDTSTIPPEYLEQIQSQYSGDTTLGEILDDFGILPETEEVVEPEETLEEVVEPEEVVDVLSGDADLEGELDSVADSLTGAPGTEEEALTEEELARIRIEERDELARILREQAERDRYFGATGDEWNSMSPEERSEQYDRYFEGLFKEAEIQEIIRLAEERENNYGVTEAEWAEMSEEERAEQQAAWLQAQEKEADTVEQGGLISIGQSSEEDREKVGGIFQSATEIAKQAGGVIAKVFESIFTPPDIEELPGGSKWVPPGTIIGVRNELPGGTGGLLGPKFVKTLILAVPTLPGKPLEIRLTDDQGNWLPAGDIGNNIYQQTTRPIRDLVGAVQDKIGEIGDILTQEGTNVFEAIVGAGGEILSGPLDILINTMGEDGAAEFLGGIITTGLESGFGEEDSGTQDDLSGISTEGLDDATEDVSGAEDDLSGIGSELGVNGGEIIDGPLLPGGGEVVDSPVQDGIPTVVRDPNAGLAPIIKDPIKQIDTTEPIAVTGTRDPDAVLAPIIKDPLKQDTQTGIPLGQDTFPTEPIKQDGITVSGNRDPNAVLVPIIKDPIKQDTQTGIPLGQDTFPTEPIRTDVTTTDLLPPAPFQDVEQEITQDQVVVEPPITDEPVPPPEPPPFVAPPPPASSGGGGMLGGTPKGYMADLPYQLPRFMGVPYDPGNPVEQLNRIILEGLFSQ